MAESERHGPGDPIRVFLLDDHEVVRRGVRDLLNDEPDIEV
ncbi:DNA-binding response regulator, partial [Streptomyces sp. NPDC059168]